ncbi:uncharacterized protein MONOS_18470 [Monocercomonoides exilis]|uniref:uncharacterized protein n=1 Tax=Monocercomonoides exilis TaxID=2049356 RepID=UPI00355A826E|nr:hypothetical protein MONOS_18470 [Monocercomonoides exilis]
MTGTVTHARMWPNGVSIGPVVAEKTERLVVLSSLWRVKGGQVIGVRGICWGMLVGVGCGGYRNSGVGARAPETKVTVCAQTVAARWAGCCWAPVYPSGWVAWLMWAEWAWGQWLQGWVVGVWLGWLAGRWCWRESSRNKSDGVAGGQGCAVGGVWYVGCGPGRLGGLCTGLIAPQGQVSETSRCHRGSRCTLALHNGGNLIGLSWIALKHANGAVGWACPAGTMWHTFGWWAVAGLRAVPEKVSIFH